MNREALLSSAIYVSTSSVNNNQLHPSVPRRALDLLVPLLHCILFIRLSCPHCRICLRITLNRLVHFVSITSAASSATNRLHHTSHSVPSYSYPIYLGAPSSDLASFNHHLSCPPTSFQPPMYLISSSE